MRGRLPRRCFALWMIILASVSVGKSFAQTPGTGAISGLVYDPATRVIANAEVLAVNEATQLSRKVVTTAEGVFRVPLFPAGTYAVTVNAAGFAPRTSEHVLVTVGETSSLDVTLSVAGAGATVRVSGAAQIAQLESSTLAGLVDETAIQGLPLSTRNYTQILGLAPGVVVDLPNATALGNGTQNVASDGATPTANNIQFNGIDANNLAENSAANSESSILGLAIPAPDAIQEFRVQTANFDAAYGRGTGANVDLVSKSGTNAFHGGAWEFVRNNIFNANLFFLKNAGQPRPDLKQNQFGASFGGPLRKDRTFLFVAYQGLSEVNGLGDSSTAILPLLTQDRSAATLGTQFCPAGHLNSSGQPATGYLTQAGGTQISCDGSNINPVAVAILNAKLPNGQFAVPSPQVAIPNSGNDPSDQFPVGQSTFAIPAYYREDQFTVDIDQILSQKNTLSGRFFYSRAPTTEPFSPNGSANVPGMGHSRAESKHHVRAVRHPQSQIEPGKHCALWLHAIRRQVGSTKSTHRASHWDRHADGHSRANVRCSRHLGRRIHDRRCWQPLAVAGNQLLHLAGHVALTKGRHNTRFGVELKRHQMDVDSPTETDGLLQISTFEDFLARAERGAEWQPFGDEQSGYNPVGGRHFPQKREIYRLRFLRAG